ncbi:hypothetical protein EXIGLDRAFT_149356 [Exidia glandulosa HHB12029]|uniref:F-box domain-containing protein n=1 Tax=Exidia glandulosa HHB12029 TaxID=1314781 RepID=A0A165FM59_EXIGL|nr:hypothetical protein EXIGLDRAFT_149356 [Exidia glandulosa HHB12029]
MLSKTSSSCDKQLDLLAVRFVAALRATRPSQRISACQKLRHFVAQFGYFSSARKHNTTSPLVALPPPALHCLITWLGPLDRMHMSQTCTLLRSHLLESPELWSEMLDFIWDRERDAEDDSWVGLTDFLVERSRDLPLKLGLRVAARDILQCELGFDIATRNLHRIQSLLLDMSRAHESSDEAGSIHLRAWRVLCCAVSGPADMLEHLRIDICSDCCSTDLPIPRDFLGGHAPRLRMCTLRATLPVGGCPAFSNVTSLDYNPNSGEMDREVLVSMLVSMQQLCSLRLNVHKFTTRETDADPPAPLFATASLQNVRINWQCEGIVEFLKSIVHVPTLKKLVLSGTWQEEFVPTLTSVFRLGTYLSIGDSVSEVAAIRDDASPVLIRFRSDHNLDVYDILASETACTNLTAPTFHEFLWPRKDPFPEAPSLTSLRILLASCAHTRCFHVDCTSIFQALSTTRWKVPALRDLHLSYWLSARCAPKHSERAQCCCKATMNVALENVYSFVSSGLLYRRPRLDIIRLSGVEAVDFDQATWLSRVGSLTQNLDIQPVSTPVASDAPNSIWHRNDFLSLFRDDVVEVCA